MTIHVVAVGGRTPIGLHAASSAAAYRAGISAARDHPFMVDQSGDPMPAALDAALDPTMPALQRMAALAEGAIREVGASVTALPSTHIPVTAYVGLPELRPGFSAGCAESIRSALMRIDLSPFKLLDIAVATEGHAGGLAAFSTGAGRLERGECEACLVGGVDSYFDADTMEWLDANRQLVGRASRAGFVPGEASGFCLLMTERAALRWKMPTLAVIRAATFGRETQLIKTADVCIGSGLTSVIRNALGAVSSGSQPIATIVCDLNGERYRNEEWTFAALRLSQYFADPSGYWSPADCWGDLGAASGPLFAMLVCQASARGHLEGPTSLLWASSEGGLRSAVILETPNRH